MLDFVVIIKKLNEKVTTQAKSYAIATTTYNCINKQN